MLGDDLAALVAMVFVGCASVGGNGYLGVLFTSEGFSTEAAAALIAVSGACLMVSKLFNGVIFAKKLQSRPIFCFLASGVASKRRGAVVRGVGSRIGKKTML